MGNFYILMDENIRRGRAAFSRFGTVRSMPGRAITSSDLSDVDILLTRSVTPITRELLEDTPVRFVGSATTGTDHVDREYLRDADIAFAHAPGANADSVVEYVIAALLTVATGRNTSLEDCTIGIVGCGEIGGRLVRRLPALGLDVLPNDPLLARRAEEEGRSHAFVDLETVLAEADILTLHTPLTTSGPHPTRHLIGAGQLKALKASAWLVNTCRGSVVDNEALAQALQADRLEAAVLDVWEDEPAPDPELIERCTLATPHIAGYSYDGKLGGTIMLYEALESFLGVDGGWAYDEELQLAGDRSGRLDSPREQNGTAWLHRLVEQMCDISADDRRMRKMLELSDEQRAAYFEELRRTYPRRRSFSNFSIPAAEVPRPLRRAVSRALDVQLT